MKAEVSVPTSNDSLEIDLPIEESRIVLKQYISSGRVVGPFSTSCMVKDVCRGQFSVTSKRIISFSENPERHPDFRLSAFNDQPANGNTDTVVLILESPHRFEYGISGRNQDTTRIVPIAPAQGRRSGDAGGAISRHIVEVVQSTSSLLSGTYPFLIVNPVPYQASLFHLLGLARINVALRNDVWMKLWNLEPMRAYFAQRLLGYRPKLIVNACTNPACCFVSDSLLQAGYKDILFKCMHPACNWNLRRRGIWPVTLP